MYEEQCYVFGTHVYLFGESHMDSRETTAVYELCKRYSPDIVCVESPTDALYPSKSTGHEGLQAYIDEYDVPLIGIDREVSEMADGVAGEQIGDTINPVTTSPEGDLDRDEIIDHRSNRVADPITNIESREENMVLNILAAINRYEPATVFVLLGQMHAPAIAAALEFLG